ncbi:aminodeoxychorismate synthase component I [Burkholderia sp. AU30280]|uniref:aminodeoxychorismate synthase component I n=1 Tax=Burkholderia sp. AU30280 TaxID=2879628 RepID=UPI001CF44D9B|nr:aminodeoxychorismate synthase component I [Burkholderia sp. AU30280]MCA8274387.1 aminodeoxychorismate synthase component I [Burkholderia sp. AU30280]
MPICRFEDAVQDQALELRGFIRKITVSVFDDLPAALADIQRAQRAGYWIGLKLSYALGEWLDPAWLKDRRTAASGGAPRLIALVFEDAVRESTWQPRADDAPARIVSARPRIRFAEYARHILAIKQQIENGDVYQVNFTLPVDVEMEGDPASLYRQLIHRHPVSHAAYIDDGESYTLSISPELFVAHADGMLTSRPMKGTAPRHADPEQDKRAADALLASDKDRAENAMIVDLLRNDLGKIARTGSVSVPRLFDLERYPSIWTLTSTIQAEVGDTTTLLEILRALFPCGSVVGAPKLAAMRCIREREVDDRGLYCGSLGWLAPNGDFSLNVAIRTLVLGRDGSGVYGVGGGIVFDSEPDLEWRECQWKSRVLGEIHDDAWT